MSHPGPTVRRMDTLMRLLLDTPWGKRAAGVVGIVLVSWFMLNRPSFEASACEWGRGQMQTILDSLPTTTTVASKRGVTARKFHAGIPRRVPEVCEPKQGTP